VDETAVVELMRLCAAEGGARDLLLACGVIARCEYPDLDLQPTRTELDRMARAVRLRLLAAASGSAEVEPAQALGALRAVLADEEGFVGSPQVYKEPASSFINDVVARRAGLPILLSAVALYVAEGAGLQAYGIGLPGHFVIRVGAGPQALYADPYRGFAVLSEGGCRELALKRLKSPHHWRADYLAPCSNRSVVVRMLTNLKHLSVRRRDFDRALWVQSLLVGLLPDAPAERRDRGLLHARQHHYEQAQRDLEAYKKMTSNNPPDAEEIERQLERINLLRLMRN
jgi:regulator of sirC expression with transglutaminase-like and TPR domain